jgi:hypothetical protein
MMTKSRKSTSDKKKNRSVKPIHHSEQDKKQMKTAQNKVNMNERAFILERITEEPKIYLLE